MRPTREPNIQATIRARIVDHRKSSDVTMQALANAMSVFGFHWYKATVACVEGGPTAQNREVPPWW